MATLASAMTRLDDADREQVDVVFVTTDPARDDRRRCCATTSTGSTRVRRAHRDARRRSSTSARRSAVAVEQGEKLPSGGYEVTPRHPGARRSTATTRRRSCGPRAPSPAEFADDIHTAARRTRMPCSVTPDADPQSIPSPGRGRLAPRAGADPRLRAVHHPRHRRRDLDRRAALGGPRRRAGRGLATSPSGRCRSASSAAGSTT